MTELFLDFALISGLLVVAHLLRTWVRFFQAVFLPTPILAGLIGLAADPRVWISSPSRGTRPAPRRWAATRAS